MHCWHLELVDILHGADLLLLLHGAARDVGRSRSRGGAKAKGWGRARDARDRARDMSRGSSQALKCLRGWDRLKPLKGGTDKLVGLAKGGEVKGRAVHVRLRK